MSCVLFVHYNNMRIWSDSGVLHIKGWIPVAAFTEQLKRGFSPTVSVEDAHNLFYLVTIILKNW